MTRGRLLSLVMFVLFSPGLAFPSRPLLHSPLGASLLSASLRAALEALWSGIFCVAWLTALLPNNSRRISRQRATRTNTHYRRGQGLKPWCTRCKPARKLTHNSQLSKLTPRPRMTW